MRLFKAWLVCWGLCLLPQLSCFAQSMDPTLTKAIAIQDELNRAAQRATDAAFTPQVITQLRRQCGVLNNLMSPSYANNQIAAAKARYYQDALEEYTAQYAQQCGVRPTSNSQDRIAKSIQQQTEQMAVINRQNQANQMMNYQQNQLNQMMNQNQVQPLPPMQMPLMQNINVNGRSGTIIPQPGGGANFYGPAFR